MHEESTTNLSDRQANVQRREPDPSALKIATIQVGSGELERAAAKFGRAQIIVRGDAAFSRKQVCYLSSGSKTYLVFEEDGEGFGGAVYLFDDGPNWNGRDLCTNSPLISPSTTIGRLRLGLTVDDVEAVIGKPSSTTSDTVRYIFEVRKKTSAGELERIRAKNPDMSDNDFQDSFGHYYVTTFVVAKFVDSRLNYLAISNGQSYP